MFYLYLLYIFVNPPKVTVKCIEQKPDLTNLGIMKSAIQQTQSRNPNLKVT